MTIPRDEITHHVLRMADTGLCTRNPAPTQHTTNTHRYIWNINIDGRPAPHSVYWALTTLQKLGYITWWDLSIGFELATVTPRGLQQLREWDTELLNPTSTRPLAGLDTAALDAEAARLINDAFNPNNPNIEMDDR